MKKFYKIRNCIELALSRYVHKDNMVDYNFVMDDTTCTYLNYFYLGKEELKFFVTINHVESDCIYTRLDGLVYEAEQLKLFNLDKFINLKEVVYDVGTYDSKYFACTTNLEIITLTGIKDNLKLCDFAGNTNVRILKLDGTEDNTFNLDLKEISNYFPNLEFLCINNFKSVNNLNTIKDLKSLISLEMNNCDIFNFNRFTTPIQYLKIDCCKNFDVTQITLKNILVLSLQNQNISDISFIEKYKTLIKLNMSNNLIEDITILENLPQLEALELGNNYIKDISVIEKLPSLQLLDLSNNFIESTKILSCIKLDYLYITGNPLKDLYYTIYDDIINNTYYIKYSDIKDLFKIKPKCESI